MKKIIALLLCLLMAASLASCGGQADTEKSGTETEQTETASAAEETEKQEESSEPVETEPAETEPAETEPAFDTSWASNDFEKLIPQPPF
ncbi:MAG: hypothetical protein ACI4XJ_09350, partial [Eubacteriales bacterium]